jgi:multicomponent Na+:H+ antiporter subunit G
MSEIQTIVSIIFIVAGILLMFAGSVGILRLPDFYARTHSVSKSDTIGIIFVIFGLIVYEGFTHSSLKLFLIIMFVVLSNPIGSHALGKAALKSGLKPLLHHDKNLKKDEEVQQ